MGNAITNGAAFLTPLPFPADWIAPTISLFTSYCLAMVSSIIAEEGPAVENNLIVYYDIMLYIRRRGCEAAIRIRAIQSP